MKKWKILTSETVKSEDDVIKTLIAERNFDESFLHPRLSNLTIEKSGIDKKELQKAIIRIQEAIKKNEKIVILGDYDVDGICASAILWETIYKKYKNIFPYIPDRFSEGYGISEKTLENILEKYPDVKLIITVDNGIVAVGPVEIAKEKGIDVVITDHHVAGELLPDAYAIVHTTYFCGAGVAWMLARELGFEDDEAMQEKLELACLATIADLVPLTDLNRVIVIFGLEYLRKTRRPGLQELYKSAGIESEKISEYHIGHVIGPRINASGRVFHAIESLRLLCTNDKRYAEKTAQHLESTNKKRQQMVSDSVQHAKLTVLQKDFGKIIGVSHKTYSEGVVGLISSRLVEEYYRPAFAISAGETVSKGSARSIHGVNIIELLRSVSHLLIELGGHPMAAGFSLETAKIGDFFVALEEKLIGIDEEIFQKTLDIDMELPVEIITKSLYKRLQKLSPFGIANREPIFATREIFVKDIRFLGKDKSHLKLKIEKSGEKFDAIGFGLAQKYELRVGGKINIAYTLSLNEWRNAETLQFIVKDIIVLD